jgi:hypothetical protein
MNADGLNRWLTLGANIGVLIGILLLIAELNQNSTLMRAQIFNERAGQGIDLFMTVAESSELSEVTALLRGADWPTDSSAFSNLTSTQQSQYWWYLRSDRFRVENLLYQQALGILENDPGPVIVGHNLIKIYETLGEGESIPRLRSLIADVEMLHREADL